MSKLAEGLEASIPKPPLLNPAQTAGHHKAKEAAEAAQAAHLAALEAYYLLAEAHGIEAETLTTE